MLKYKCDIASIGLKIAEEESYTSKTSSITGDLEKKEFNGKRVKRGLFKDHKTNKVYNADLNGTLNIAIKELGKKVREQFLKLLNWLDKLSGPVELNLFCKYSASVLKDIADSISLSSDRRRTFSETFCWILLYFIMFLRCPLKLNFISIKNWSLIAYSYIAILFCIFNNTTYTYSKTTCHFAF